MKKTLGLDLGTNSLGWAILDDLTGDIIDKGVVVFPEGIDAANDTLETPAAIRRAARMARRMKFRRRLRKMKLLEILCKNGMSPICERELETWKKSGAYPVNNKAFINWLKSTDVSNPYADRAAAAAGKVPPLVLGRALYHIAQRRGFKSSRKDAEADGAENKDLGAVKGDIATLTQEIADAGCSTLGQYFSRLIESERGNLCKTRIRKRYTGRVEHYMKEFAVIMAAQGIAPNSELYKSLYKAIFLQRPLRSQTHLVGKCPLEGRNPRALIGHPAFEEFRMRAFVNNLSFVSTVTGERIPLAAEDRELACSAFMNEHSTIKFSAISKLFKKKFKNEALKFYHYESSDSVAACSMQCKIKNGFGDVPYDEQKVFDALTFYDDDEMLRGWFRRHYPALTDERVERLVKIHPKEGNAQYSLKAINKILPFLRKGHDLFTARLLAKMPDVISQFAEHEEEIVLHIMEMEMKCRAARESLRSETASREDKPLRLMDLLRDYFLTEWNLDDKAWNSLYLRGDEQYEVDAKRPHRIPAVKLGMIRNPLVQRSMTTLRRLVNYLRDHGKIDGDTTIRIELARNVNDYASRHALQLWQKDRADLRDKARKEIESHGFIATEDLLDRYILWEEQGRKCLYTNKPIGIAELLSGGSFDVEHTVPRSMSGDDSLANKTLCDAKYNRQVKKGMVPTDCPNYESEIFLNLQPWRGKVAELEKVYKSRRNAAKVHSDPQVRAAARIKVMRTKLELDYWRDKLRRFEITSDRLADPANGLSGFKRRQLVDTGIMSSHAVELLRSVYPNVYSVNGAATAFARKAWGIQGDEAKDRSEHTHHAKDAMVIAALTPSRFNAICTALKDDGRNVNIRPCDVCKSPYDGFAQKVSKAADEILVKHVVRQTTLRQSSKKVPRPRKMWDKDPHTGQWRKSYLSTGDTVRGALHKDTFYGCIARPENGEKAFVIRKPLIGPIAAIESLTEKIVDPAIKSIVESSLADLKAKGVKSLESGMIRMPSGVPINKVRIFADTKNPMQLRNHVIASSKDYKTPFYVKVSEGSNFRLAVFEIGGELSAKPDNLLYWAQQHKKNGFVPYDRQDGFIGYIYPGSMAIVRTAFDEDVRKLSNIELKNRLYCVVSVGGEGDNRAQFRYALAAGMKKDLGSPAAKYSDANPPLILRMGQKKFLAEMLFEGIHFKMMLDGTIVFLK